MSLYRQLEVWVRLDKENLARYRCIQVLPELGYCVLSKDFIHALSLANDDHSGGEANFARLLAGEIPPDQRYTLYPTVQDAVAAYEGGHITM